MDIMIVSADGVGHTATVLPTARGNAPVVLCLPAMGAAVDYYAPFAQAIAAAELASAVLLDLRGQGRSTARARNGHEFGYREILELDLPKAIFLLRHVFPGRRLYVAGHSLGGQLALLGAARPDVALDGLILIAAGTSHWGAWRGMERVWARAMSRVKRFPSFVLGLPSRFHAFGDSSTSSPALRTTARASPTTMESSSALMAAVTGPKTDQCRETLRCAVPTAVAATRAALRRRSADLIHFGVVPQETRPVRTT